MALFNINPAKLTHPGWHQIMSLPRCLTLTGKDELGMEPAGDTTSLRGEHRQVAPRALPANQEIVLENIQGNVMEIVVQIDPREASTIEMNVLRAPGKEEYTRILFFSRRGSRNWERYAGRIGTLYGTPRIA